MAKNISAILNAAIQNPSIKDHPCITAETLPQLQAGVQFFVCLVGIRYYTRL